MTQTTQFTHPDGTDEGDTSRAKQPMADNKSQRGRPRVPLDELYLRWKGPGREVVERHSKRSLAALYDEMLAFMPKGIVDDVSLMRFLGRYQSELEYIFHPPFAPAPTDEDLKRREEARASLGERGDMQATRLIAIIRARAAYHQAQTHAWKRDGSIGAPPPPPGENDDQWFEEQVQALERIRQAVAGMQGRTAARPSRPPARHSPEHQTPPDEPPDLGDEVTTVPKEEDWTEHVTWDGKEQTISPRDAMRPYLEARGRMDLLELYDDEVVQYGPVVRRWIGGRLR